jgi:hypothetical protein
VAPDRHSRLARRLRAAGRPSIGLALTALGTILALAVVLADRGLPGFLDPGGADPGSRSGAEVCVSERARLTVRRNVRFTANVTARKPVLETATASATEALPDGSASVMVTATASRSP